jgi:hypothetical protein
VGTFLQLYNNDGNDSQGCKHQRGDGKPGHVLLLWLNQNGSDNEY